MRDPKTGRFVSKKGNEKEQKNALGETEVTMKLTLPLPVYGKKSLENFINNMPQGSEVVIKKTKAIGPTGSPVVRVKKNGSTRTFYTTMESAEKVLTITQ